MKNFFLKKFRKLIRSVKHWSNEFFKKKR